MTPAEKALEIFKDANEGCQCEGCLLVISSLQRAAECEKAFELTKRLWLKQTDENKALKDKTRGLVNALQKIGKWFGEFPATGKTWEDGTLTSYAAEYGSNGERDFMRGVAIKAIADFEADEIEGE